MTNTITLTNTQGTLDRLLNLEILAVSLELHAVGETIHTAINKHGDTLLSYAVKLQQGVAVDFLLDIGADPDAPSKKGKTPLMHAVQNPLMIKKLLDAGADMNKCMNTGYSALRSSILRGFETTSILLIESGAVINRQYGAQGHTYLHDAVSLGQYHVVEALLYCGADVSIKDNRGLKVVDHAKLTGDANMLTLLEKYIDA